MPDESKGQALIDEFFDALRLRQLDRCRSALRSLQCLSGRQSSWKPWRAYLEGIWAFEALIDPETLPEIKLESNRIEARWAVDGKRQVNLDPGYVSMAKLVLATTKNHGHRIYVGQGIYAEVTLQYRDKAFRPWPWTYPDYGTPRYCELFAHIRQRYLEQVRPKG